MEKKSLERYFARIGLTMPENIIADGELLEKIFHAQVTHIPYENIDYLNLRKEPITQEGLYRQIVENGRGGVCYDLNTLLGDVLCSLGYEAYPVMADHYRTHMENTEYRHSGLIVKDNAGDKWLSDVGDSFSSSLKPMRLLDGVVQKSGNEAYLLQKREDGSWMLLVQIKGEWIANYAFREEPSSLETLTYFKLVAMDPKIPFTREELFHIRTENGFRILRGRTYCEKNGSEKTVRTVEDNELEAVYASFGLKYPYTVYRPEPEADGKNFDILTIYPFGRTQKSRGNKSFVKKGKEQ